jgi:hypothetical protein
MMSDIKERLRDGVLDEEFIESVINHIEQQEAEIARLRKDAERYRAFRRVFNHPYQRIEFARFMGVDDEHFEPSLDAAIDRYLAKTLADTSTQEAE